MEKIRTHDAYDDILLIKETFESAICVKTTATGLEDTGIFVKILC
jgi:hypothetical protein